MEVTPQDILDRQLKFTNVSKYHEQGFTGKGITVVNTEYLDDDHAHMTTRVLKEFAPDVFVINSQLLGSKRDRRIYYNKEYIELEEAIKKFNIKLFTNSLATSGDDITLNYYKELQEKYGVMFFSAAGNDGEKGARRGWHKNDVAIAVASGYFKVDGTFERTGYSAIDDEVDFIAPMGSGNGTSSASPALTGMVATLLQKYGDFTQQECVEILKSISMDIGVKGKDPKYGWGLPILPLTDRLAKLDELRKNIETPIEDIEPIEELPKEEELKDVKNECEKIKKVMIDSGHYPNHPNKGQTGYWEYQGVWKISNYLKEFLEKQGIQADLTKTYEETFNNDKVLTVRGKKAQGYDLFISEHSDAMPTDKKGTVRGVKTFYDFSKPKDKVYAEELSLAVSKVMNNPNRGAETRTYVENGKTYNYYGVIRGASATNCPHIFLIENGFHDNLTDEAFLKVDENLKKIAEAQANVILKILGIEVKEMTFDEAKKTIQDKAKLDNNSMQYLEFYKYGEDLIKKLAVPMVNNIIVKEPIIEQPKVDNSIEFTSTVNGTFQLSGRPQDLKLKVVNKSNTSITEDNCVNSTFFWQNPNGTKYATSILYAEGVTYQYNANHLPSPQSVFIIYKDNTVTMKRLHNLGQIDLSKVKLAIGGVGLVSDDPTFKYNPALDGFSGAYSDVLRKTNKTVIGYNKKEDRIYLMCRPNIVHQSTLSYDLLTLVKDCEYTVALSLDGSGSSFMRANGNDILNGDGRVIHSILYF